VGIHLVKQDLKVKSAISSVSHSYGTLDVETEQNVQNSTHNVNDVDFSEKNDNCCLNTSGTLDFNGLTSGTLGFADISHQKSEQNTPAGFRSISDYALELSEDY
jgi:hypothetical protein